jgi:predicted N-formylglutamate amidohydrolase
MAGQIPTEASIAGREEDSYIVLPGRTDRGLIIVCDHAGNALPPEYGTLGLPAAQLQRHIAYDIGVAPIVRTLSADLGVPAVMTSYSRLLIDPNRGRDDPTLIMRLSDGAVIPGNRKLDAAERDKRARLYYEPYHRTIDAIIDQCLATGVEPLILSVHSFTESWKEFSRPWHVGVLWDGDGRLANPLLESFHAEGDLIVGENEPYAGRLEGDCIWQHGEQRGLAGAIVEIRQDLIRDEPGQRAWSQRICRIVAQILRHTGPVRRAQTTSVDASSVNAGKHGDANMTKLDKTLETEIEAAAFRRLVQHLRSRTDVQNIDLMNLAGFCRNCLANWYQEAAAEKGLELGKDGSREIIYGMPYKEWQAKHQKEASAEAKAAFQQSKPHHA